MAPICFMINTIMRILEILLPKGVADRSLPPGTARRIGLLQNRMNSYVDKIMSPGTSQAGKEFLKSRLRDDYHELKQTLPHIHKIAEEVTEKYEVFDRRSGEKVSGPYANRKRASTAADKKDLEYGAIRYGVRVVKTPIAELFSGGKQWKTTFSGSEEYTAEFRAGEIDYTFHAYKPRVDKEPEFWDVEFKVTNTPRSRDREIDGAEQYNKKFGITGTGNSAEVMSTVVDIMRSFLREHNDISKITFSAKEDSRQKLYKAMISRLLPGWRVSQDAAEYTLTKPKNVIAEAVTKLPLTQKDFDAVIEVMKRPIPAAVAPIYIQEIIEDDELNDQLFALEESDPGRDVRPLIADWFKRVMPDQMYRFTGEQVPENQKLGTFSPIHGYDPHMYKGTNDPITGNAYGSK
jgi:hypothetical protein